MQCCTTMRTVISIHQDKTLFDNNTLCIDTIDLRDRVGLLITHYRK